MTHSESDSQLQVPANSPPPPCPATSPKQSAAPQSNHAASCDRLSDSEAISGRIPADVTDCAPTALADATTSTLESEADEQGRELTSSTSPATRNFLVLALYQVVVRTGWIFKTESIIMPAVLDLMGGSALLRGCLPMLNRFGHSIPPMMVARRVNVSRFKKIWLLWLTLGMSACFLSLSVVWRIPNAHGSTWLPLVFLGVYAGFFMLTGINQLVFSTLQGKLIRPDRRGRQMLVANLVGAVCAILLAAWLLPLWLTESGGRFELIFGMTGICFLLAAFAVFLLVEPGDRYRENPHSFKQVLAATLRPLWADRSFRLFAVVAGTFGATMMLFPHYQALGRESLETTLKHLMVWVVVQNIGTAIFSLLAGPIADRFGNRTALQCAMLMLCGAPSLSIVLSWIGPSSASFFPLVFLLLGATPVTIKLLINYTLEFSTSSDHPRYVSTLGLCISGPIMILSPIIGWLVGGIGFVPVFAIVIAVTLVGWVVTFFIHEPRDGPPE